MGETCPYTPLLVFIFFTLAVATLTTGSINCQTGLLPYPFGFSDGYPIRFNCSKNGSAEIGEFTVQEVTSANIVVGIPVMCTREISKFEQLFRDNFAPSNKHNSILLIGCNDSPLSCMLNSRFLETIFDSSRCAFPVVRCFDGQKTKTADVMSINEVTLNLSGCKYLYSSVSGTESALTFERLSLDWWLEEGCTNTTCSENANCTQVTLPEGRLGHRCTCLDGYHGDAFNVNGSCRSADKLYRRCSTPFNCGDLSELSYPFWISGREDCGHPDFELDCSGGFAELNTSSVKYRILQVTNNPRIIRLARSDYMSNLCPQNPQNASFNKNVFLLDPDTEVLTIYYDCPLTPRFDSAYVGEFACEDDTRSYYVTRNLSSPLLAGISEILKNFEVTCRKKVSIPASGPALNTLLNNRTQDNLKKALQRGFKLGFNSDCPMCIDSGGACGYNQITRAFLCYCPDGRHNRYCGYRNKGRSSYKAKIGIGITSILVGLVVAGGLLCFIMRRQKSLDDRRQQNLEALIPLKRYSYAQVKKITNSFAKVVGKGGFGTVYRGTLCDGGSVAVKLLKDSKTNSEDFMNEVASMSKTSHVNIVNLLGFCSEGSKRAILYEFLENGSLDKFISRKTSMTVDWKTLYNIALGIARGLEYLHHGCKARIVHFDIKPQNVLLDDNLCPKVSDFGLAKLCEKKESLLSVLDTRGTIGYIAPEVFSRMYGRVSHKSDVYSYGMLVLEMIGARNKERSDQNSSSNTSSMYFPEWIYKDLEKGRRIIENGISIEEEEIAKKITLVGLWCIQSSPSDRPPMNKVVEMLEGNLEALEVPPRPVLQIPSLPLQESSSLLMDISVCTEA